MRKLITVTTVVAVLAGFVLAADVADAAITTPAVGAVLAGTVSLTDSPGASITNTCSVGNTARTTINLINSANAVVFTTSVGSSVSLSTQSYPLTTTINTHSYPNGNYTVQGVELSYSGGTLGFGCKSASVTSNVAVSIHNVVAIQYSGATSAAQGTVATVSATLTDPNLATSVLASQPLTFGLVGGSTVNATTNSNGVATASLSIAGPPRSAILAITFPGTTFYDAKTVDVTFNVLPDPTATTISPTVSTVHGQGVSFSASVAPTAGSGVPTGTIQFTVDGSNFGTPVTLSGGVATSASTTTLSTGSHAIGAHYGGDTNFLFSDATAVNQQVNKAGTSTLLTADQNPTVSGQSVTFTATVGVTSPGVGTPTGGVQFDIDGQPFGTAVALSGTQAQLTISNLATGTHPVTATYDGDTDFAASTSGSLSQGVNLANTSTVVTSSAQNSVYGQGVTFTATVSPVLPGAGTPTGSIGFYIDQELFSIVPLVDGVATSPSIADLGPGNHDVLTVYSGDPNFNPDNGDFTQTVGQDGTKTVVSSSVNPSVFGQAVTFHAVVTANSPGAGTPTGQVQFFINGVASGPAIGLSSGAADSEPVTDLAPGGYTVTAVYSGDVDFLTSTSDGLSQTVNKSPTTTTVTSDGNPSVFGQPVTFTATVAVSGAGAGSPTGTVTFVDGSTTLGTVDVGPDTGEQATLTTSTLVVAQHAITATYSGDADFLTSNNALTQNVTRAQTSTLVTSSANPAQSGQAITFSATITPVAPGAGNPSGTVVFTVNGAPLGSPASVNASGVATSTAFASLTPGMYTISATYGGDGNFVGSSALLDQGTGQNITQGATTETLSGSPNPSGYGHAATFTATVSAVAPATGKPSGVVDFYEGDVLLGASSLAPAGAGTATATFADSSLAPGNHTITAVYVGNFNFTAQTATTVQTVNDVSTTTSLTSSENPSVYGSAVTFTAVITGASPGTPTGTVTFSDGSSPLAAPVTVTTVGGTQQASVTVSSLGGGNHTITATYSGDPTFAGSAGSLVQKVVAAPTSLTATPVYTVPAADGHLSATLTGNGQPLAGQTLVFSTLTLNEQYVLICDAVTNAAGVATCDGSASATLSDMTDDGGYYVTYTGSANFQGSSIKGPLYPNASTG